LCSIAVVLLCLQAASPPLPAALSQADLQGHWTGTLINATMDTTYALDFNIDSTGVITGTGDNLPMNSSTLMVQDSAAGTVKGALH